MRIKAPKEDPKVAADRQRERQIAEQERSAASQDLASGLTTDFRQNYLRRSLFRVMK